LWKVGLKASNLDLYHAIIDFEREIRGDSNSTSEVRTLADKSPVNSTTNQQAREESRKARSTQRRKIIGRSMRNITRRESRTMAMAISSPMVPVQNPQEARHNLLQRATAGLKMCPATVGPTTILTGIWRALEATLQAMQHTESMAAIEALPNQRLIK
jgi:hypothetical protein